MTASDDDSGRRRDRRRALDAQGRRAPVPLGKISSAHPMASPRCCSSTARRWRRNPPSTSASQAGRIRRSWTGLPAADSSAGRSTWKATGARTSHATSIATSPTAPTIWPLRPTTSGRRAASSSFADLRHLVRRAARRAVRAAASRSRFAAGARRLRLDRRRRAHARATTQEAARVPGQQAASHRPRLRLFDLRARSS